MSRILLCWCATATGIDDRDSCLPSIVVFLALELNCMCVFGSVLVVLCLKGCQSNSIPICWGLYAFWKSVLNFLILVCLHSYLFCSAHVKITVPSSLQSKKSRLSSSLCHWLGRCGILRRQPMRRGSSGSRPSRVRYLQVYSHVKVARIR